MPAGASRPLLACALVALVAAGTGCGGGSPESVAPGSQRTPGGTLAIALPAGPETLDPFLAQTRSELVIARQLYESLWERLSGPYGEMRSLAGLVSSGEPAAHGTIWRLHLRHNVSFQDGARYNASAVLANVRRWRTTPQGGRCFRAWLPRMGPVPTW